MIKNFTNKHVSIRIEAPTKFYSWFHTIKTGQYYYIILNFCYIYVSIRLKNKEK